jgi:hypothetical protein
MARIFIDSFESGSFDLWDAEVGFPSITSTSGLNMRGDYCFLCDSGEAIRKTLACGTECLHFMMAITLHRKGLAG